MNRRAVRRLLAALAVFSAWSGPPAAAHDMSESFSSWSVRGPELVMEFGVPARQVTLLRRLESGASLDGLLNRHLERALSVRQDDAPCMMTQPPRSLRAAEGYARSEVRFRCPVPGLDRVVFHNDAFFPLAAGHVHFARARSRDGGWREVLFTLPDRVHALDGAGPASGGGSGQAASGPSLLAYVRLGVEHILAGADHLAFVLALLLLCGRARDVVVLATGFTLGHTLTLSLAVLGLAAPDAPVIEALIGFTIAVVAAEGVAVRHGAMAQTVRAGLLALAVLALASVVLGGVVPPVTWVGLAVFLACYGPLAAEPERAVRLAPLLTVMFGFVHGFGFAGVLLDVDLPPDRLAVALFGFNAGVEIGQVMVIAVAWPAAQMLARHLAPRRAGLGLDAAGAVLCALGVYWFASRAFDWTGAGVLLY